MPFVYIDKPDAFLKNMISAAFPEYLGRKIKLDVLAEGETLNVASCWEGGSRSFYKFVNLTTLATTVEVPAQSAYNAEIAGVRNVLMPEGVVCVQHSILRGEDVGITIHVSAKNAAPLLPAAVELSRNQKIVLYAIRSLKSSYGGISNYRFHSANQQTGITLADWETAKAENVAAGLLAKNGAITADGKNAVNSIHGFYSLKA